MSHLCSWKDKALFTPGPLTTSRTVKQAMLRDLGHATLNLSPLSRMFAGDWSG